jgi:hypothetical protein
LKLANTAYLKFLTNFHKQNQGKKQAIPLWSYGSQGKDNQREITAEESSEELWRLCHEPKFYL